MILELKCLAKAVARRRLPAHTSMSGSDWIWTAIPFPRVVVDCSSLVQKLGQ